MSVRYNPYHKMTASEFRSVVSDYGSELPFFNKTKRLTLERIEFPIRQSIWFQKLKTGDYRPTNSVSAIPFGVNSIIHEVLDVKHRECGFHQHPRRWGNIASAMKIQFSPDVQKTIDHDALLSQCRTAADAIPTPHPCYRLFEAVLAAWLGRLDVALLACDQAIHFQDWIDRSEPQWLGEIRKLATLLRSKIETNEHIEFLQSMNDDVA